MRTIKELLQLMLDNKQLFELGLCFWASNLAGREIITWQEMRLLETYIANNRPSQFSSIDAFRHSSGGFYWKADNIKPRIKWLKKHIAKN